VGQLPRWYSGGVGPTPRQKLWLELDGRIVMSDYRVRLLELVRDSGSLARAAAEMGLSYRRAWGKLKELEENLGQPLVESVVGGAGGGRTRLTPFGEAFVEAYRRFQRRMADALEEAFGAELAGLLSGRTQEARGPRPQL